MFYYRKLIPKEGSKIENKICTCFGHREVFADISGVLSEVIEDLILSCGVTIFWTGGMGETDEIFASTVRQLKEKYPQIKLILIKPYTRDLRREKLCFRNIYDDVVIPDAVAGANYRQAIPMRNEWMIYNSNFIITYVNPNKHFGGAYNAKRYAQKNQKIIFEINDMLPK